MPVTIKEINVHVLVSITKDKSNNTLLKYRFWFTNESTDYQFQKITWTLFKYYTLWTYYRFHAYSNSNSLGAISTSPFPFYRAKIDYALNTTFIASVRCDQHILKIKLSQIVFFFFH